MNVIRGLQAVGIVGVFFFLVLGLAFTCAYLERTYGSGYAWSFFGGLAAICVFIVGASLP